MKTWLLLGKTMDAGRAARGRRAAVSAGAEEMPGRRCEETGEAPARCSLREFRSRDAGDSGTEGHGSLEDGGAGGRKCLGRPRAAAPSRKAAAIPWANRRGMGAGVRGPAPRRGATNRL